MKLSSSIAVRRRVIAPVTYKITASEPYIAKNADGSLKASDITIGLQKVTGEKVEEMDVSLLEITLDFGLVIPADGSSLKQCLEAYGVYLEDISCLTVTYDAANNVHAELTLQSVQDGAQGTSALELYTNNSLVYTTNNNGIVEDFSPSVTVKAMLGSSDVTSSCTFAIDSSATAGCTPTVTKNGGTATVKLTAIETESVKGDDGNTYTVSRSSAVVGLTITYNGKTYKKQLPVSVSVSKMVATFKSDVNGISLKYDNLTDGLSATGIDITNKKIKVTADKFEVYNNSNVKTISVDKDGNLVTEGNATVKGSIYATGGQIGGISISNDALYSSWTETGTETEYKFAVTSKGIKVLAGVYEDDNGNETGTQGLSFGAASYGPMMTLWDEEADAKFILGRYDGADTDIGFDFVQNDEWQGTKYTYRTYISRKVMVRTSYNITGTTEYIDVNLVAPDKYDGFAGLQVGDSVCFGTEAGTSKINVGRLPILYNQTDGTYRALEQGQLYIYNSHLYIKGYTD